MSEINFKELNSHLKDASSKGFAPVYLIFGEEYLTRKYFNLLLSEILPEDKNKLGYEPVDPAGTNFISETAEILSTFSFVPGNKVVSLCDADLFHSKKNDGEILKKSKELFEKDQQSKAGRQLAKYLAVNNINFNDLLDDNIRAKLEISGAEYIWIEKLAEFCISNQINIPENKDEGTILQNIILKGYPANHYLIITTDFVDKRKSLFKTIKKNGVVVNCHVPKGDNKADKQQQNSVLRITAKQILDAQGKSIDEPAFQYMLEITGFDMGIFTSNIEKLLIYTGSRKTITLTDAKQLLSRTKTDPVYELTGAVAERRTQDALFFVQNLLDNSFAPLQILSSVINQIRKLLLAKDYLESQYGKVWNKSISYSQFQNTGVIDEIKKYDNSLESFMDDWNNFLSSKKKSEIGVAKGFRNNYPLFLLLKNADRFQMVELKESLKLLLKADLRLKSTGEDPKIIIDETLMKICNRFKK